MVTCKFARRCNPDSGLCSAHDFRRSRRHCGHDALAFELAQPLRLSVSSAAPKSYPVPGTALAPGCLKLGEELRLCLTPTPSMRSAYSFGAALVFESLQH